MNTKKILNTLIFIFLATGLTTSSYAKHKKPWSKRKKAVVGFIIGGALGAGIGAGVGAGVASCCCSKVATGAAVGLGVGAVTGTAVGASRGDDYCHHCEKRHKHRKRRK